MVIKNKHDQSILFNFLDKLKSRKKYNKLKIIEAMSLKTIKTKVKDEFLKNEKPLFPTITEDEFKEFMEDDAVMCKQCGVWYWLDCEKRCDCI